MQYKNQIRSNNPFTPLPINTHKIVLSLFRDFRFSGEPNGGGKKERNCLTILQTSLVLNTFGKGYKNSTAPQNFTCLPKTVALVPTNYQVLEVHFMPRAKPL